MSVFVLLQLCACYSACAPVILAVLLPDLALQVGLSACEQGLQVFDGLLSSVSGTKRIQNIKRSLRAVKRAGARQAASRWALGSAYCGQCILHTLMKLFIAPGTCVCGSHLPRSSPNGKI